MFRIQIEELNKRSKLLSCRKIILPFKTLDPDPELKKFVAVVLDPQHWKNEHVVGVKRKQAKKKKTRSKQGWKEARTMLLRWEGTWWGVASKKEGDMKQGA